VSRASRDTILGWTKSGALRLLLEFQRATAVVRKRRERCRELAARRASVSGVAEVNATIDRHAPDTRASGLRDRRLRRHAGRARTGERRRAQRRHGARIRCGPRTPTRIKIPVRHCGQRIGRGSAAACGGGARMGAGSMGSDRGTVRRARA
jgi:hypothetical protein